VDLILYFFFIWIDNYIQSGRLDTMSTALMQDCTVCVQTLKLLLLLSFESSPQMWYLAILAIPQIFADASWQKLSSYLHKAAAMARVPWQLVTI
jgi:hypothetical protein